MIEFGQDVRQCVAPEGILRGSFSLVSKYNVMYMFSHQMLYTEGAQCFAIVFIYCAKTR